MGMILRLIRWSTVSCFIVFAAACATTGQQKVDPQITAALSARGVTGSTYNKVANGRKLDYNDILLLVEKGVPAHIVESYLQSTEAIYQLTSSQTSQLRSAGAAPQLLSYLGDTGGFYGTPVARRKSPSAPSYETTDSPLYQDEQPFAYNAPEVDHWYNSAYEESLYSPFSFDGD